MNRHLVQSLRSKQFWFHIQLPIVEMLVKVSKFLTILLVFVSAAEASKYLAEKRKNF